MSDLNKLFKYKEFFDLMAQEFNIQTIINDKYNSIGCVNSIGLTTAESKRIGDRLSNLSKLRYLVEVLA